LACGPIAVFHNTSIFVLFKSPATVANIAQRILGLTAFTMLFIQILLGSFMPKLIDKFGGWIFSFHIFQGVLIYTLIFLHPLAMVFHKYFVHQGFDPFYVFTDICFLCQNSFELLYSLGKLAFWFITISVLAGLFRTATPWMRVNWRKLHLLNYVSFMLIAIHSFFLGTDIGTFPFSFIHMPAIIIITCLTVYKLSKYVWATLKTH